MSRGHDTSDEIREFIRDHQSHGQLTGDATEPTENGYQVTITCPCGVVFIRWLTPDDAVDDIFGLADSN